MRSARPGNPIDKSMTEIQHHSIACGQAISPVNRRFCVAPMLDWTDRYCRYFLRLLTKRSLLYTEMITTGALLNGDYEKLLKHDPAEHPLALQLGGNHPGQLAQSAQLAESYGYAEINLNCGCPSNKVQQGQFGACLMKHPQLVAECISAMCSTVNIPVTVKHRIGVDRELDYGKLVDFVGTLAEAGCQTFIVHARMAWLDGISPRQNRTLPPLEYKQVDKLKIDFPDHEFVVNGGITTLAAAQHHLNLLDGVMMGREAYKNPFILADVDRVIYGQEEQQGNRLAVIENLLPFVERELAAGTRLHQITRHILGLFHGQPGGKKFRQHISTQSVLPDANTEVLTDALAMMQTYLGRPDYVREAAKASDCR